MRLFSLIFTILFLALGPLQSQNSKINYLWHKGQALLKTDLKIDGEFRYQEEKNGLPFFLVKDIEVEGVKKIPITMFQELTLMGAERGVSSKKDTTEFVWVSAFNDLLRKVRSGEVTIYDNSKIINEDYKSLAGYFMAAERAEYGFQSLRKVSDLEKLMVDRPYFMKSTTATGKSNSSDFRVMMYLVDLFNDKNPMKKLKWKDIYLETKNGDKYRGKGYIQPMDVRNEYSTGKKTFIHFYDGEEFKLFTQDVIGLATLDGQTYELGYFPLTDKHFWGIPWKFEEDEYLIAAKIVNRNSYFYIARDDNPQNYVLLKKSGGSFIKPENEIKLKLQFFEERGNQ